MNGISEEVMQELERRGATPRPRWHFLLMLFVFWLLAAVSVAVGAVAFAAAFYVFVDNDGMNLAQLRETPLKDIALSIPYVWLFILALFTACAYYSFRHTRSGHRYATAKVVSFVFAASIIAGILLNFFDFGQTVHQYLLSHTSFYDLLVHSKNDAGD